MVKVFRNYLNYSSGTRWSIALECLYLKADIAKKREPIGSMSPKKICFDEQNIKPEKPMERWLLVT